MKNLHPTQKKLLSLIKKKNGDLSSFSLRNIGEIVGVGKNPQTVAYHLGKLEDRGIIREDASVEKKYSLLDSPAPDMAYINLYSCTGECGPEGVLGEDSIIGRIPLPTKTFGITNPEDFFLIKARGDSMEPTIRENDLVLAKKFQADPPDESIAVIVHEEMPKIKKISHINKGYLLKSLNEASHKDVYVNDETEGLRVVGLVKGIIRKTRI
jgi:SOS-response transcriptional repressor LexA